MSSFGPSFRGNSCAPGVRVRVTVTVTVSVTVRVTVRFTVRVRGRARVRSSCAPKLLAEYAIVLVSARSSYWCRLLLAW